jgi:hypothetical protein
LPKPALPHSRGRETAASSMIRMQPRMQDRATFSAERERVRSTRRCDAETLADHFQKG